MAIKSLKASFVMISVVLAMVFVQRCSAGAKTIEQLKEEVRAQVRREFRIDEEKTASQRTTTRDRESLNANVPDMEMSNYPKKEDIIKIAVASGILGAVILMIVLWKPGKKGKKGKTEKRGEKEKNETNEKEKEPVKPAAIEEQEKKQETAIDIYEKIERLQKLKVSGAITVQEYENKKKELLDRI